MYQSTERGLEIRTPQWIEKLGNTRVNSAADVKVYWKANLTVRPEEYPIRK